MRSSILLILLFFCSLNLNTISAQELSYGFKVGLNFSSLSGDSELDDSGAELEKSEFITGFHVGGTVLMGFTDRYGVKADIMFSQKGGRYRYDGQAFMIFDALSGEKVLANGTNETFLRVINAYIDIPIMGYARFNWIEFNAGINVGFLVNSTGVGETVFKGNSFVKNDPVELSYILDHNYFKDELNTIPTDGEDLNSFDADGEMIEFPSSVAGYFGYDTKDGNRYKGIDLGLNAGVSFYINQGLYIGLRGNYGLSDVSNNFYDRSQVKSEDFNYTPRADKDVNLSVQASIGFSF